MLTSRRLLTAVNKRVIGRWMSSGSETEKKIHDLLHKEFDAEHVVVQDISGGCGAMYTIQVVSSEFEGKNRVAQHRMVNEVLKAEIANMHGLTLKTLTPAQYKN